MRWLIALCFPRRRSLPGLGQFLLRSDVLGFVVFAKTRIGKTCWRLLQFLNRLLLLCRSETWLVPQLLAFWFSCSVWAACFRLGCRLVAFRIVAGTFSVACLNRFFCFVAVSSSLEGKNLFQEIGILLKHPWWEWLSVLDSGWHGGF